MKYTLTLACALLIFGFTTAQSATSIKQMQWLEGSWKMEKGPATETWNYVNDTTFAAISTHSDDDGEAIVDEMIRIVLRGSSFYYIPLVPDQNKGKEVEFKITSFTQNSFVAENKAHDFPQRIVYQLKDASHLYAYIEGNTKGKNKKVEFSFVKKK